MCEGVTFVDVIVYSFSSCSRYSSHVFPLQSQRRQGEPSQDVTHDTQVSAVFPPKYSEQLLFILEIVTAQFLVLPQQPSSLLPVSAVPVVKTSSGSSLSGVCVYPPVLLRLSSS